MEHFRNEAGAVFPNYLKRVSACDLQTNGKQTDLIGPQALEGLIKTLDYKSATSWFGDKLVLLAPKCLSEVV